MNQPNAAPLAPLRPIPRATYRLQLHKGFGFTEATRALPYLAALGISHVYCSPYLHATPGSMHGYDVIDPTRINPDLGTPEDFDRFNQALRTHGLTQLLDIVPNHMGVESDANAWWQDVLRQGRNSPYAAYFDIDWSGASGLSPGKLLLPVLGADLQAVIARREIKLRWDDAARGFQLTYFERHLPVNSRGTALIFQAPAAGGPPDAQARAQPSLEQRLEDPALIAAVAACQHYELAPWQDAATRINYRRFFDVSGLAALRIEDPAVFEASHRQVIELVRAGIVSGLRVDHPDGLRDPGAYFKRLQAAVGAVEDYPASTSAGTSTGALPVAVRTPTAMAGVAPGEPLYIVAEKILAEGEDLPADWPVSGTTGYDFANLACGVLLDGETAGDVDRAWRDFTGETATRFGDLAVVAKKEVIQRSFGSEMGSLARKFLALLPQEQQDPQELPLITAVLAETIACFPVYRTYPGPAATPQERRVIRQACIEAAQRLQSTGGSGAGQARAQPSDDKRQDPAGRAGALLAVLEEILTGPTGDLEGYGETGGEIGTAVNAAVRERALWAVRFQQLSAPVMAKGVEDTALYRWTRLVSINDVGADPDVTGVTVDHFHQANARRRAGWPHSMLATSTHDNKRGEYVRMRINLISEDPAHWQATAAAWRMDAGRLMTGAGMKRQPSVGDQYLLFQTFIGTWPVLNWRPTASADPGGAQAAVPDEEMQAYGERLKAYMTKACREAKLHTSWTETDEEYEKALHRLVDLVLGDRELGARIGRDVCPFAWFGAFNSLSLTALKLTVPGVPDIYQGAHVLDDSLVDPDNRRPVDFGERRTLIGELTGLAARPAAEIRATVGGWAASGDFARLKLWTIHRLLGWRALHPQLFETGEYVPVPVKGKLARHIIAYARRNARHGVLVVTTRLYRELGFTGPDAAQRAGGVARAPWEDEFLDLAAAGIKAVNFQDVLCSSSDRDQAAHDDAAADTTSPQAEPPSSLAVRELLSTLPIAVLSFDADTARR